MTREEKQHALEAVSKDVEHCQRCPLFQTATHGVPGEGNPEAEILFVGEGPGQKEDELGRPFVGAAGRLLEDLLKHISLTRNDVYIANVVKHRPPGNRDPLPDELEACWPYLERQLEIIQPKVIVTLGRHSLARFLPGKVISHVHGKPFRLGERVYFAMYHPAAALYSGNLRPVLFEDIARLPKVVEMIREGTISASEETAASLSPPISSGPAQGSLL